MKTLLLALLLAAGTANAVTINQAAVIVDGRVVGTPIGMYGHEMQFLGTVEQDTVVGKITTRGVSGFGFVVFEYPDCQGAAYGYTYPEMAFSPLLGTPGQLYWMPLDTVEDPYSNPIIESRLEPVRGCVNIDPTNIYSSTYPVTRVHKFDGKAKIEIRTHVIRVRNGQTTIRRKR